MTKEKRKKKNNKFKIYIVTIIIVYLMFRIVPILKASNLKTITANIDTLEIKENTKAIVFKKEEVYTSKTPGQATLLVNEGEKVSVGTKIVTVSLNGVDLLDDVEKIDEDIKKLKENNMSKDIFKGDLSKNYNEIEDLTNEIRKSIINHDYNKANELKEQIKNKVDKQLVMSGGNSFNTSTIRNLEYKKQNLLEKINSGVTEYYSRTSGIISYKIDGLENIYTLEKLDEFKIKDFNILDTTNSEIKNKDTIKNEDEIFKVIDNFKWYVVFKLSDINKDKMVNEGEYLTIRTKGINNDLRGKVIRTEVKDKESLIVLELNRYLHELYDKRYLDIEVIIKKYTGLLIPRMAIIDKDGVTGVYIKDTSGISRFRAIDILGKSGDKVIVRKGEGLRENNIEINVDGKLERVKTITLYDEVFIRGDKIKEGEILN